MDLKGPDSKASPEVLHVWKAGVVAELPAVVAAAVAAVVSLD
jgi:hypothetical protein